MQKILITGGAGFIGNEFVRLALQEGHQVLNVDALTYAGDLLNLSEVSNNRNYQFAEANICDQNKMLQLLHSFQPDKIVNFAAESHVDNSIENPQVFLDTNIIGTYSLLQASNTYFHSLSESEQKNNFIYLQISTDEVFGDLGADGFFTETTPYNPHSPYSASKAASDHLVRAWKRTYGLPTIITNCSNNYGPRQMTEKLIPLMISKALSKQPLPVYGTGQNVRDWIHVHDHCRGVYLALMHGQAGGTYCFGGRSERTNLQVVQSICGILEELAPTDKTPYSSLISFVTDRKGHDWRYAIDDSNAEKELGFKRKYNSFEDGLRSTIKWYLSNKGWVETMNSKLKDR